MSLNPLKRLEAESAALLDMDNFFLVVILFWTLFCAAPLFFMIFECGILF